MPLPRSLIIRLADCLQHCCGGPPALVYVVIQSQCARKQDIGVKKDMFETLINPKSFTQVAQ